VGAIEITRKPAVNSSSILVLQVGFTQNNCTITQNSSNKAWKDYQHLHVACPSPDGDALVRLHQAPGCLVQWADGQVSSLHLPHSGRLKPHIGGTRLPILQGAGETEQGAEKTTLGCGECSIKVRGCASSISAKVPESSGCWSHKPMRDHRLPCHRSTGTCQPV
jgi:hypothetical protein